MAVGSWSTKNLSFFQLIKRDEGSIQGDTIDLANKGQMLLGQEAMRKRIETVLDEVGVL